MIEILTDEEKRQVTADHLELIDRLENLVYLKAEAAAENLFRKYASDFFICIRATDLTLELHANDEMIHEASARSTTLKEAIIWSCAHYGTRLHRGDLEGFIRSLEELIKELKTLDMTL